MAEIDGGDFGYRLVLEASLGALMDLVEIMGLVEEGVIGEDEVRRMSIPPVGRTRADLVRPHCIRQRPLVLLPCAPR